MAISESVSALAGPGGAKVSVVGRSISATTDDSGRVEIGGVRYPVVAAVSASHTILEIGDAPAVRIGDTATLFGWSPGVRPEDVSAACGASVYDLTMHLNALLPRRLV